MAHVCYCSPSLLAVGVLLRGTDISCDFYLFLTLSTLWTFWTQAEEHVRRLSSELEALQDNAAAFGLQRTGLAGRYPLPCHRLL